MPTYKTIIAYWYRMSRVTCKWFRYSRTRFGRVMDASSSRSKEPAPSSNQRIKDQKTSRLSPVSSGELGSEMGAPVPFVMGRPAPSWTVNFALKSWAPN